MANRLSTGIEPVCPGHVVSVLAVGARIPGKGDQAQQNRSKNSRVGLPVRRLSVPATCWRPDVLGIPVRCNCERLMLSFRDRGWEEDWSRALTGLLDHHPVIALAQVLVVISKSMCAHHFDRVACINGN